MTHERRTDPYAAGALALALALSACVLARPAQAPVGPPPGELGGESVAFPSASGATVHAWLSPGRAGGGAVLVLHGVRSNRLAMRDRARFLRDAGFTVLVPDLQAHGETLGAHVTFGALESHDAAAALAYLRARAPGERIGVIGISMGGAAALVGAGPLRADALVLESVYPSLHDAVRGRFRAWLGPLRPLAPAVSRALLRAVGPRIGVRAAALRPIDRIATVAAPVLVAAGTDDRYTSLAESRALFARAPGPKTFWAVQGAAHEDLHAFAPREYERRVGSFLAARLRRDGADAAAADAAAADTAAADTTAAAAHGEGDLVTRRHTSPDDVSLRRHLDELTT